MLAHFSHTPSTSLPVSMAYGDPGWNDYIRRCAAIRQATREKRARLVCEHNLLADREKCGSAVARVLLAQPSDPNDEWAWDGVIWPSVLDGFRADEIQREINRLDGLRGGVI